MNVDSLGIRVIDQKPRSASNSSVFNLDFQKVSTKLAKVRNVGPVLWLERRAGIAKRITHIFEALHFVTPRAIFITRILNCKLFKEISF